MITTCGMLTRESAIPSFLINVKQGKKYVESFRCFFFFSKFMTAGIDFTYPKVKY